MVNYILVNSDVPFLDFDVIQQLCNMPLLEKGG